MSANNASSAPEAQGKGKKKGGKFTPFPGVVAAESNLPWCIESTTRIGRHAVAQEDIPAGTLVMLERPFLSVPMAKYATAVCHRCLEPLEQAAPPPPKANPCLPRYCPACKEVPHEIDAKLAALRIKLPDIATQNSLDPIMLHIITLLDLQRSGITTGVAIPAPKDEALLAIAKRETLPKVVSTVADFDTLPNLWDRKAENWRKRVGPAVRALHKELVALAESGAIPGYKPSPIIRLQSDAAAMSTHIQSFSAGTNSNNPVSTAVGIFPTLSVFQQSCVPNAFFKTAGCQLMVRTIQDVAKGAPITVSYVGLTEPRSNRQAILEGERHQACSCPRCAEPLKESIDRLLEGVVCSTCQMDVLIALPEGPENEVATEDYKKRLLEERQLILKAAAKRAAKGSKGKASGSKRDGKAEDGKEDEGKERETEEDFTALPEGVMFWRCCGCGSVEPAHNVRGGGPGDVIANAGRLLQEGATFLRLNHPELMKQGEAYLDELVQGLEGRLPPYNAFVLQALAPLVNLNMKKGDAIKVMNYALQLWDIERQLVEYRPTMQQLQCLEAVVDAAEHKVAKASSAVLKRQFAKRLKSAIEQYKETRMLLEGR